MAGADCRRLGTVPSGGAFGALGLPVDGGLNAALDNELCKRGGVLRLKLELLQVAAFERA